MKTGKKFLESYLDFLGCYDEQDIIKSDNRDILINSNFYYPIIVSFLEDEIMTTECMYNNSQKTNIGIQSVSVSPKYYDEFVKYIKENNIVINKNNCEIVVQEFAKKNFELFKIKKMYRMYKDSCLNNIDISEVEEITEKHKNYFFNIVKKQDNLQYKQEKWKEFNNKKSKYKMSYGIIKDNKIASLGYISNIIGGLGNIIIQTEEEYRGRGYATRIIENISKECVSKHIIPTYWVEAINKPSIKVAQKAGFKEIAEEIVCWKG